MNELFKTFGSFFGTLSSLKVLYELSWIFWSFFKNFLFQNMLSRIFFYPFLFSSLWVFFIYCKSWTSLFGITIWFFSSSGIFGRFFFITRNFFRSLWNPWISLLESLNPSLDFFIPWNLWKSFLHKQHLTRIVLEWMTVKKKLKLKRFPKLTKQSLNFYRRSLIRKR